MAEANAVAATDGEEKKLSDIFLSGWNLFDELEVTELPFNGIPFQVRMDKPKDSMSINKYIFI